MKKNVIAIILVGVALCALLTGCGEKKRDSVIMGRLEENAVEAESLNYYVENNELFKTSDLPAHFERKAFPSMSSMLLELNAGNIDYFATTHCVGEYLAAQDSRLSCTEDVLDAHYHMATRSEDTKLCTELSAAIDALKANGDMDALIKQYITDVDGDPAANMLTPNPGGETHIVGVTGDLPPLDYVSADGKPAGFNVALLNAIAEQTGRNFEIVQMDANARLTALTSKKIDIIFWNSCLVTGDYEPTSDGIALSSSYFQEKTCLVTRDYPAEKVKEIYGLK